MIALSPSDYRLTGLDEYGGGDDELYSGQMPLYLEDNTEGSFFFYMAKMRKSQRHGKKRTEKLLIWLNGNLLLSPVF